ncbi:MAG: tripartite tricarboxylate transporter substrate-binding protein [Rhodovarius sp.]|nr:tripartite tricarboxylate transporter substrate-binding protein [Rhodovarius sp.]MCX7933557.1 tripartite tricarboxylate transporter substrate-binding protein [Rhodovarius sp.]MDW8313706.1 tripartite tricarboxylate transporter substrate-binding protein [Rhodovarius sp.]
MTITRRAGLIAALGLPAAAAAQPRWPERQVRFLQGFAPGGTTDIVARLIAPILQASFGQPVVVENRPGAGSMLAAEALARSTDGHTIMLINNGFAVSAALYRRLPFDPRADIAPLHMVASIGLVLLVANTPEAPRSLPELIARARAAPGVLNLATVGVGSTQHFVAEAIQAAGGFRLTHVPYRGTPAALIALRNGEVQVVSETASAVIGQIRAGEVRALAITSATRSALLPDVPTVAELLGQPFEIETWFAIAAPAHPPPAMLAAIAAAMERIAADAELRGRLTALGLAPREPGTPASTRAAVHAEIARWAEVIERTNMERPG